MMATLAGAGVRESRHLLWRIALLAASVVQLAACGGRYSTNPAPGPPKVTMTCPSSLTIPATVGTGTTTCTITTMGGQNMEGVLCNVNSSFASCSVSPNLLVLNSTQTVTVTVKLNFSSPSTVYVFVEECQFGFCYTPVLANAVITIIIT